MQYKALIFDLDGTAIPNKPHWHPSPRVIETVTKAKQTFKVCAATGRPITGAKAILDELNLTDPCIISGGTQIVNPRTHEILWEATIEDADVASVLEVCKPYHYEILLGNELMGEGSAAADRGTHLNVNVIYIMQCTEADGEAILAKLSKIPDITATGVLSWTNQGLDVHVTHREATKEHAVEQLLKMLNVSKDESIGIGDGGNDIHLFKGVGLKVAMGNATPGLKESADQICDTVEQDGLATFIEEILRSSKLH